MIRKGIKSIGYYQITDKRRFYYSPISVPEQDSPYIVSFVMCVVFDGQTSKGSSPTWLTYRLCVVPVSGTCKGIGTGL